MSDSIRRLAGEIAGLKRDVLHLQTAPRAGQTSIEYGGAITVVDPETGAATARLGTQTDDTYGAVTLDGPIPPIPSAPILDVAPGLVAVTWDGTHADGAATPLDFHTVEVYVAAEPFAFIEEGTLSGSLVGSDGDRITIALAPGVWHVGLVTVSQAMKRSRLSSLAIATVSALPSDEDIALAGGRVTISDDEPEVADAEGKPDSALWQQVVNDVLVGAWRLDAAVPEWRPIEVAPGTPYMPKIDLGSATVGLLTGARLAADAIDGKTITGATVQSSALANRGVKMDSGGLRAFSNTGVRTVNIDSATGAAEFVGGFKTATTGRRVEIGPDPTLTNRGALLVYDNDNTLRGSISISDTGHMFLNSTNLRLRGANSVGIEAGGTGGEISFSFFDYFRLGSYRRFNNIQGRWEVNMYGTWEPEGILPHIGMDFVTSNGYTVATWFKMPLPTAPDAGQSNQRAGAYTIQAGTTRTVTVATAGLYQVQVNLLAGVDYAAQIMTSAGRIGGGRADAGLGLLALSGTKRLPAGGTVWTEILRYAAPDANFVGDIQIVRLSD